MSPPAGVAAPLLVRGALVVDGSGAPAHQGDVLLAGGRVAALGGPGALDAPAGARVVEADGLAATPGFIDLHAHSDLAVLTDPAHLARTTQGVTTEVLGQDGLSYAPVDEATLGVLREQLAGWNGVPGDLAWSWRSVGEYLDAVDRGAAVNVCYLVPQGTVRMLVVGPEQRPATAAEVATMRAVVATGLAEGAVGMSSGLTYAPGMYASTDELVALCAVVAAHGGFWSPHHRSYGHRALEAYAEVVDVARRSGCALHLTHATMNFAENRGRAGELLALVDAALDEGLDVTLDSYPYLPGSTSLAALLPGWASAGGPAATLARLADPSALARIRTDLEVTGSDGCHGVVVDWASLQISGVREPELAGAVGATLAELAAASTRPAFEVFTDLLVRDRLGTTVLQHVGDEANVREIMRHPVHTAGSDGLLVGARPHPRAWGTFARYLGLYARELGVLGLEECVARMTSRPARRLGLADRGLLRAGAVADVVLLDPSVVRDAATFEEPRRPAEGIVHVLVAGVPVIDGGERTDAVPGRSLRRTGGAWPPADHAPGG